MPQWMDELDELIKGMAKPAPPQEDDDEGEFDGDGDDDGTENDGEEDERPVKKAAASRKGCYPAADNGDDDDENGEQPNGAAVRDPDKIDKRTGGKKIKQKTANAGSESGTVAKSVRDLVDEDAFEVIDGAHALAQIADAVDTLVGTFRKSLRQFASRLGELEEGQALIGQAVTKSLHAVQGEVEEIARQPRDRKAVTKAVERKFAGHDAPPPFDRGTIMAKSLQALKEGRITALESASVDAYVNGNREFGRPPQAPPPHLLAKINGAS